MNVPCGLRRHAMLMALAALPLAAQRPMMNVSPMSAHGPALSLDSSAAEGSAVARLLRVQGELIQEAVTAYRARVVATLPGWRNAVRDVERRTNLVWIGLPPVILIAPDVAGRGFRCDERDTCLGRFSGANVTVSGTDSTVTTLSSIILIAESATTRRDVWAHELTHALLAQHGLLAESARHDRRYFAEERFVRLEF